MVQLVETPNRADAIKRLLVADMTTERIRRIGRVNDDTAGPYDFGGLHQQPALGVRRVNVEILAHDELTRSAAANVASAERMNLLSSPGLTRLDPNAAARIFADSSLCRHVLRVWHLLRDCCVDDRSHTRSFRVVGDETHDYDDAEIHAVA